jgi:flavin-binding protein dodecin
VSDHVYKQVEITGTSKNTIEEAVTNAIEKAAVTVRNMRWIEVTDIRGQVANQKLAQWQVTMKIGFTLEE